jgi:hypothetical protein
MRPPTQRVALAVEQRLLGNAPARVELFKIGSQTEWIEEDPPYSVGERYLLFVRPRRGDGRRAWLPVSPDGRLRVTRAGDLQPLATGPVADALRRTSVRGAGLRLRRASKEAR